MHNLLNLDPSLEPIQGELASYLGRVVDRFDEALQSDILAVQRLTQHVERYRGKMLRPALVALSAGTAHGDLAAVLQGPPGAALEIIGAVCEMVHMATLVHDDVLDEADTRRRGRTVNAMSGNETAVILGDYLIAGAYHLCSTLDEQATALRVARASMVVCSGELLQLDRRDDLSLDEATYFEIIDRKTAELIAAACELGATAGGGSAEAIAALEAFGRQIGAAFQVRDDLLDLTGREEVVGKSVGRDARKGKLTLPVIHHLSQAEPAERAHSLALALQAAGDDSGDAPAELRGRLESTASVQHAQAASEAIVGRARERLEQLADSPSRRTMLAMADAVVNRSF
ncbi:MAG: polyprenyl synthetase family protein [Phycisphaerales bacterium]